MIISIDIPIYSTRVLALVEFTEKELQDFYSNNKNFITEKEYESLKENMFGNKAISGFTFYTHSGNYFICLKDGKSSDLVSHEIFNVCNLLLHNKGVMLNKNAGALAYLMVWLSEEYHTLYWEQKGKDKI